MKNEELLANELNGATHERVALVVGVHAQDGRHDEEEAANERGSLR